MGIRKKKERGGKTLFLMLCDVFFNITCRTRIFGVELRNRDKDRVDLLGALGCRLRVCVYLCI